MADANSTVAPETGSTRVVQFHPASPLTRIFKLIREDVDDEQALAPKVRGSTNWWAWFIEGQRSAVIAAALAEPSWFASGLERTKRGHVVRKQKFNIDGREIITVTTKTDRVRIVVRRTDAEKEAYQELNRGRKAAEDEQWRADASSRRWDEQRAKWCADEAAKSRDEWRQSKLQSIEMFSPLTMLDGHGAKCIGASDREKVVQLYAQMLAVVRNCEVVVLGGQDRPRLSIVK